MKLDKKLVDEVIKVTRKYYETGDEDYLPKLFEARYALSEKATWKVSDLLTDLARYTQRSNGTYEDIYRALAVFGIIVEDKDKIK